MYAPFFLAGFKVQQANRFLGGIRHQGVISIFAKGHVPFKETCSRWARLNCAFEAILFEVKNSNFIASAQAC